MDLQVLQNGDPNAYRCFGVHGVLARWRDGARRNSDAAAWWMCGVGSGSFPVGRRSGATPVPTEYCLGNNLPQRKMTLFISPRILQISGLSKTNPNAQVYIVIVATSS